jgi:hypothetical protein
VEYFRRVRADLAPDGRVAVIEYDGRKGLFVKWMGHHTDKQEIRSEMEAAGYRLVEDVDTLDRQSFQIFAPG